jgi:hypothetical protein
LHDRHERRCKPRWVGAGPRPRFYELLRRGIERAARGRGLELLLSLLERLGPVIQIRHAGDIGTGPREPKMAAVQPLGRREPAARNLATGWGVSAERCQERRQPCVFRRSCWSCIGTTSTIEAAPNIQATTIAACSRIEAATKNIKMAIAATADKPTRVGSSTDGENCGSK